MSNVGIGLGLPDSAEEEFMEAVRKQSIGVRPSKDPVSPTERRLGGVKPSLRPVMRPVLTNDPGFYNQTTPPGAATGKAEKEMMVMMMMAQIPAPTVKAYARPSYSAPSTGQQMNIARTTLTPSVMPLRLQPDIHQQKHQQQPKAAAASVTMVTPTANHQQHLKQPKAVAASVTMAAPTAKSAHRLVPVPLSSPLQGIADRWAWEIDAARERRKQLKRQFRRDFGIEY